MHFKDMANQRQEQENGRIKEAEALAWDVHIVVRSKCEKDIEWNIPIIVENLTEGHAERVQND
jgi:hypothetical protein